MSIYDYVSSWWPEDYKMLALIVALILFLCLVVFVALTLLLLKGVKKINYDTAFVATFEDRGMDSIE